MNDEIERLLENSPFEPELWGIQSTKESRWKTLPEGKIEFNWNDLNIDGFATKQNLTIAVAQRYTDWTPKSVRLLADEIYKINRIATGAIIFDFTGEHNISRAGVVVAGRVTERTHEFEMEWAKSFSVSTVQDFFSEKQELKKLPSSFLNLIPSDVIQELIVVSTRIYSPDRLKLHTLESMTTKKDPGGEVELFYGTNRKPTGKKDVNDFYSFESGDLILGKCKVSIPRGHVQGNVERPVDLIIIEWPENKKRHVVIEEIGELPASEFIQSFNQKLSLAEERVAFIYIHGFNVSFDEAARNAAQITWDIPYHGVACLYSWPSSGKRASYLADIERADLSGSTLSEFIELLLTQTSVEKLHLIAHSMGSRVLCIAISDLTNKSQLAEKLKTIDQVIFGAADIDQEVFTTNWLPRLTTLNSRKTLYSSDKDLAIYGSETIRHRPRLGSGGSDVYVDKNIDTVDATNVPSSHLGHSYIFETKELLGDLFLLLRNGFTPLNRRLKARTKNTIPYWLFPE